MQFWEAAFTISSLASTIDSATADNPLTLFLPWDFAVERGVDDDSFDIQLLRQSPWFAHLREYVLLHVFDGFLPAEDLECVQDLVMSNGDTLRLTVDGSRTRVNGFRNIGTMSVSNGYIYLLSDFLRPSWIECTILDVLTSSYTTFATLLASVGLEETLSNFQAGTVFATDDAAFTALGQAALDFLQDPANEGALGAVPRYHILEVNVNSFLLPPNSPVTLTTLNGANLLLTRGSMQQILNTQAVINSALVLVEREGNSNINMIPEILVRNGIVYEIDGIVYEIDTVLLDQGNGLGT